MSDSDWKDIPEINDGWVDVESDPKEMGFIQSQVQQLPVYGAAFGGVAAGIPSGGLAAIGGAALGAGAGQSLKDIINHYAYDEKKSVKDTLLDPAIATAQGATAEMGGQILGKALPMAAKYVGDSKAGKAIGEAVGNFSDDLGQSFRKAAGEFAENATGATGAQAAKFKDGAGNELLDRGLVKFGDNAKKVAGRVGEAMDASNAEIDDVLKTLDAESITVSADNIVKGLENKIASLQKDASQASVVKKLQGIIEDITATGESNIPVSMAEQTKRGFNKMAGNWMNPEVGEAGKTAYQSYRGAVEDAATGFNPDLGKQFEAAKKTYGLLAPIEEAASRRASTLNQSPLGGFLDMATGATGAVAGGAPMGVAASIGRRVLAPRVSSSVAVTLNEVSKSLMKSPQMAALAKKSPEVFNALVYKLQNGLGHGAEMPKAAENQEQRPEASTNQPKPGANVDKNMIINKLQGSKYHQVLQNAANNGEGSFSAAHYILSQRDPEYRKQIEDQE